MNKIVLGSSNFCYLRFQKYSKRKYNKKLLFYVRWYNNWKD